MIDKKFDDAFLKAVDFAFRSLGKSCQLALYFHLKTIFHLERADIPYKVDLFDDALNSIFKDGAVFLEKLILERLCQELKVKFEEKYTFDFVEAVSEIRNTFLEETSWLTVSDLREEVDVVKKEKRRGRKLEES